jgi:hypothetical protein
MWLQTRQKSRKSQPKRYSETSNSVSGADWSSAEKNVFEFAMVVSAKSILPDGYLASVRSEVRSKANNSDNPKTHSK